MCDKGCKLHDAGGFATPNISASLDDCHNGDTCLLRAPGAGIDRVISLLWVRRWQGRIISPKSGGIDSRRHYMKLAQRPKMANNMLGCAIEVTDKTRTGLS
jgi:hypothetical protein